MMEMRNNNAPASGTPSYLKRGKGELMHRFLRRYFPLNAIEYGSRSKAFEFPLKKGGKGGCFFIFSILFSLSVFCLLLHPPSAYAQEDVLKTIVTKQKEIKDKEEALRTEEARLITIRKEVDEKIEKYTKVLAQIESALGKMEQVKDEKIDYTVKAYEAMPPEDAAARLSALDEAVAVRIISRMKSKKAGAVMAQMQPAKAASITESMTRTVKNFPSR
jgi:hypothetical protein